MPTASAVPTEGPALHPAQGVHLQAHSGPSPPAQQMGKKVVFVPPGAPFSMKGPPGAKVMMKVPPGSFAGKVVLPPGVQPPPGAALVPSGSREFSSLKPVQSNQQMATHSITSGASTPRAADGGPQRAGDLSALLTQASYPNFSFGSVLGPGHIPQPTDKTSPRFAVVQGKKVILPPGVTVGKKMIAPPGAIPQPGALGQQRPSMLSIPSLMASSPAASPRGSAGPSIVQQIQPPPTSQPTMIRIKGPPNVLAGKKSAAGPPPNAVAAHGGGPLVVPAMMAVASPAQAAVRVPENTVLKQGNTVRADLVGNAASAKPTSRFAALRVVDSSDDSSDDGDVADHPSSQPPSALARDVRNPTHQSLEASDHERASTHDSRGPRSSAEGAVTVNHVDLSTLGGPDEDGGSDVSSMMPPIPLPPAGLGLLTPSDASQTSPAELQRTSSAHSTLVNGSSSAPQPPKVTRTDSIIVPSTAPSKRNASAKAAPARAPPTRSPYKQKQAVAPTNPPKQTSSNAPRPQKMTPPPPPASDRPKSPHRSNRSRNNASTGSVEAAPAPLPEEKSNHTEPSQHSASSSPSRRSRHSRRRPTSRSSSLTSSSSSVRSITGRQLYHLCQALAKGHHESRSRKHRSRSTDRHDGDAWDRRLSSPHSVRLRTSRELGSDHQIPWRYAGSAQGSFGTPPALQRPLGYMSPITRRMRRPSVEDQCYDDVILERLRNGAHGRGRRAASAPRRASAPAPSRAHPYCMSETSSKASHSDAPRSATRGSAGNGAFFKDLRATIERRRVEHAKEDRWRVGDEGPSVTRQAAATPTKRRHGGPEDERGDASLHRSGLISPLRAAFVRADLRAGEASRRGSTRDRKPSPCHPRATVAEQRGSHHHTSSAAPRLTTQPTTKATQPQPSRATTSARFTSSPTRAIDSFLPPNERRARRNSPKSQRRQTPVGRTTSARSGSSPHRSTIHGCPSQDSCSKWLDDVLASVADRLPGRRSSVATPATLAGAVEVVDMRTAFRPTTTNGGDGEGDLRRLLDPAYYDPMEPTSSFIGSRPRAHVATPHFGNAPRSTSGRSSHGDIVSPRPSTHGLPYEAYSSVRVKDPQQPSAWALAAGREAVPWLPGRPAARRVISSTRSDSEEVRLVEEVHLDEHRRPYIIVKELPCREAAAAQRASVERLAKPRKGLHTP